jgi:hypothetical protein
MPYTYGYGFCVPSKPFIRAKETGNAAADLLEETKKSLIAELMTECNEKSSSAKETYALHQKRYRDHIESMVVARKAANKAKVRYDSAKVWVDLLRTQNANERAANRSAV